MKHLFMPALLVCAWFLTSCGWRNVKGNGNLTPEGRNHTDFRSVKTAGAFDLEVKQGSSFAVTVEAEENLLRYIETRVDKGVLRIYVRKGVRLRPREDMKVYVTAPLFRELSIAGSGNITSVTTIVSTESLAFTITGSGDINIPSVDAPELRVKIAGSGNVRMSGQTRKAEYRIAGGGDIRCSQLLAEEAAVHIAGSGNAWVFASELLDVHIAGSGDVHYYGNPVTVKQKIAGSGRLLKE
ncbi:MAG TPA: head GIN domain-containing protein [Lacibacter sp.]|nr:head GIN domain-containing protein [Lacibacter sp.]HMO89256.1 head GIN domain-containing protein [Lacibacter sp.]